MPSKGFTFIEVILVVVIIGVILVVSIPNLSQSYNFLQLQTTANNMGHLMRYAQSRSIVKQQKVKFVLEDAFKEYGLLQEKQKDDGLSQDSSEGEYMKIEGRWGGFIKIPDKITVTADKLSVLFFPDGQIEGTIIRLCNGRDCMVVSTQQQRGRVYVFYEKNQ